MNLYAHHFNVAAVGQHNLWYYIILWIMQICNLCEAENCQIYVVD